MNVLKAHLRITIATLLANGASQREIERRIGVVERRTEARLVRSNPALSQTAPEIAPISDYQRFFDEHSQQGL